MVRQALGRNRGGCAERERVEPLHETNAELPASAWLPENGKNVRQRKDRESQKTKLEKFQAELRGIKAFQAGDFAAAREGLKNAEPDKVDALFQARVQWLAGEKDEALKKAREALGSRKNQVRPLALAAPLPLHGPAREPADEVLLERIEQRHHRRAR